MCLALNPASLNLFLKVCPISLPLSPMQSLEYFLDHRNILLGSMYSASLPLPPCGGSFSKSQILVELFRIILLTSRRTRRV